MTTKRARTPAARAKDRARCAAYYRDYREQILQRRRSLYAHDAEHREAVNRANREHYAARKLAPVAAYRLGYAAGVRDERERNAQSFADFTQPSTPAQAAGLLDPTGNH
jgi:hypothetical protein